jgi:CubicO group peptidase (beta-lactamase class C family)
VFFRGRNGYGAAMQVIMPGGEAAGQEPAGSYGWFGIAGTQMFVDPVNKYSVVMMLQMNPTSYPVQAEYKVASYKDLATLRA